MKSHLAVFGMLDVLDDAVLVVFGMLEVLDDTVLDGTATCCSG